MARHNANDIVWGKIEIFGKECLFSDLRIDRKTIPEGWFMYEVRHDDEDWSNPVEIGLGILVNFFGTIITKEELKLIPSTVTNNAYLDIDPEKDWNYIEEYYISSQLKEFES